MSKRYRSIYKCRCCGAIYENGAEVNEKLATKIMISFVVGNDTYSPEHRQIYTHISDISNISMLDIHHCADHAHLSLADFQGFKIYDELEKCESTKDKNYE